MRKNMLSSLESDCVTNVCDQLLVQEFKKINVNKKNATDIDVDLSSLDMSRRLAIIYSNTSNCSYKASIDFEELEKKILFLKNNTD